MSLRHRLLFELGRGGMGTVYLAVAQGPAGFSKLKVVKVLSPRLASEPQYLNMFMNEARLAARLNHPNIVQTFEVGVDGEDYFIEMEYLDGQPYDALLRRSASGDEPLGLAVHLWILSQACAGLHYAHELRDLRGDPMQIVHRDVSPHNVFVTYDGAVKVLDFGIAKAIDSDGETRTGVVKGKVTYMAPEQATKKAVDRRVDVFAVGVMLWQAATGRRMWEGLDDVEIFLALQAGNIPRAKDVAPSIDDELDSICARATAADAEERFATVEALQEAIDAYAEAKLPKVGVKRVAKMASQMFADRREAVRKEIEAQIHGSSINDVSAMPAPREREAAQETVTGRTGRRRSVAEAVATRGGPDETRPVGAVRAQRAEETLQDAGAVEPEGSDPALLDATKEGTRTSGPLVSGPAERAPLPTKAWRIAAVVALLVLGAAAVTMAVLPRSRAEATGGASPDAALSAAGPSAIAPRIASSGIRGRLSPVDVPTTPAWRSRRKTAASKACATSWRRRPIPCGLARSTRTSSATSCGTHSSSHAPISTPWGVSRGPPRATSA